MFRLLPAAALLALSCSGGNAPTASGGSQLNQLMAARNLKESDVTAALKTYTPTGKHDEYYLFASGGHSGQILVVGLPSMRILKVIAVFTPEPWQGYGFGGSGDHILAGGKVNDKDVLWGDTHHPSISESEGSYDGQCAFINDKANARLAG